MGAGASRLGRAVLGAVLAVSSAQIATAAGPPLRRNIEAFHIFALRSLGLKNYVLNGACNVGVDCQNPTPSSSCGVETQENASFDQGSQIAADVQKFTKPGAVAWQVFTNTLSGAGNVNIGLPPPEPLSPLPILPDVDGDTNPSCKISGGQCIVDAGDLAAACGFPSPFPTCNPLNPVVVQPNADCVLNGDTVLNNGRCDLPPGTYGIATIGDNAKLNFTGSPSPANYTFCDFTTGQSAVITADKPVVLNVNGTLALRNDVSFGPVSNTTCGQITVNVGGPGQFTFGRHSNINGFFCAPERTMFIGHDNDLTGRFFGDVINADSNNRGFCCPEGAGCACFNSFTPAVVIAGATLTINGNCTLTAVTSIDFVCDAGASTTSVSPPFISQSSDKIEVAVPSIPGVAPHTCSVVLHSAAGTFTGNGTLTVN